MRDMRRRKKGTGRGRKLRMFAWVLALGLAAAMQAPAEETSYGVFRM